MARLSTTLATRALFQHAAKHRRLERFLAQGQRRALTRSAGEAQRAKTRAILSKFNLRDTEFSSIRPVRALFTDWVQGDTLIERVNGPKGIPVKHFGARQDGSGLVYSFRRGRQSRIRSGFVIRSFGSHGFTRKGRSRGPLRKRFGPGIPTMSDQPDIRQIGAEAFQVRVQTEVRKEETRAFKRAKLL